MTKRTMRIVGSGIEVPADDDEIHDLASEFLHDDEDAPPPEPALRPSQRVARIVLDRAGVLAAIDERIAIGVPGIFLIECGTAAWSHTIVSTIGMSGFGAWIW